LYDTRETTDVLFRLTEIFSGAQGLDYYHRGIEELVGPSADKAKELVAKFKAEKRLNPYIVNIIHIHSTAAIVSTTHRKVPYI
jgi:hypothetical protein